MKRCESNSSLPSSSSSVSSSSSSSIVVDQEDIIIDSLRLLHNQPTPHPPPNNSKRSSPNHKNKRVRIGKRTGIDDGGGGRNNGSKRQRKPNDSNAAAFSAVVPTIDDPADAANPTTTTTTTTTITNAGNRKGGGGRSSVYRGVTRHRWTGRFEAHLWDKACWNSVQNKKGRQVYLGAYDSEEDAARTYDLAALKYWGPDTTLNFPLENYGKEVDEMQNVSREEYLASLRRRSSGFSRGVSKYRGVARHHHNGRWEARIGRVLGNKYLYLGTFSSQEEAAIAYDLAAIEYRGANAVTNFDISNYFGHAGKKNLASIDQIRQQQNTNNPSNNIESNPSQHQHPSTPLLSPSSPSSPPNTLTHRLEQLPDSTTPSTPPPHQTHTESYLLDNSLDVGPKQEPDDQIWNFCSENIDFDFDVDSYLVPHIPLDEDGNMLDLFGDTVFQDNIDLVFQGETTSPSNLNDQLDGLIQQVNIDVFADGIAGTSDISCSTASKNVEEQNMDNFACFSSLSPLSASSSTTTSSMLRQL